jgi:hypothetical protein
MIKGILDMLELAKGDSELIQIAQGKYYLPDNFKDTAKKIKTEYRWHKNT